MPPFEFSAEGALDSLVSQFSSALDCYRELVQNAIDAGSTRVSVWSEFIPGKGGQGAIALHVDDSGEGMDEQVIDSELTRLFSSSKEDDLTKIGKFGIGFVSVFALEPRAVLVHTGRRGEYWEVLFHHDRSFTKTAVDTPVEGTQITLFLEGDRHRYYELVAGTRAALKRWCCHSDTRITFEDRSDPAGTGASLVNEPFEVTGDCVTRFHHAVSDTEIVLAYTRSPAYGFFNKGLTLLHTADAPEALGGRAERFARIAFKLKSAYIEHTLSRETIQRDANYDQAVALLEEATGGPLRTALLDELEDLVALGDPGPHELERYFLLLDYLRHEPPGCLLSLEHLPLIRRLDGGSLTLAEVRETGRREGRVFLAAEESEVTELLGEQGIPVIGTTRTASSAGVVRAVLLDYLIAREKKSVLGWIARVSGIDLTAPAFEPARWVHVPPEERFAAMLADPRAVYLAVEVEDPPPKEVRPLLLATREILASIDAGYARLASCVLRDPDASSPLFLLGKKLAPLMARPPRHVAERARLRRPEAAVNRDHPRFRALLALSRSRPALAAYALAKNLLLTEDRLLESDTELMQAALLHHQRAAPGE